MLKILVPALGLLVVALNANAGNYYNNSKNITEPTVAIVAAQNEIGSDPHTVLVSGEAASPQSHQMVGDIKVSGTFARATLPNAPVAGGFLTLTNTGDTPDRLIAVTSPMAGRAELHEMAMQGDVMKMRALEDGIEIAPGETVTLKPGGLHLMFFDLKGPFVEGETVPVTITFEHAGDAHLDLAVGPPNAH